MNKQSFVDELSKLRPSSMFLALMGYRNSHSEISDYSITFHMSYENALKKSIHILQTYIPTNNYQVTARQELLDGYHTSLNKVQTTAIEDIDDAYTRFFDESGRYIKGIKLHTKSNTLHLYGLVVHKKVLMPGIYPQKNKRELTAVKDQLRRMTTVGRFRQFIITPNQVNRISVEGLHLLPPSN